MQAISNWYYGTVARVVEGAAGLLSEAGVSRLARAIGRVGYHVYPYRMGVMEANLHAAFPTWDRNKCRRYCKKMYQHLALVLIVTARLKHYVKEGAESVSYGEDLPAGFIEDLQGPNGILLCTGHVGVWELLPILRTTLIQSWVGASAPVKGLHVVYRPFHHRQFDRWMIQQRSLAGATLISDKEGECLPMLHRALGAGDMVGLVADHESRSNFREVCFLGRPSRFYTGLVQLHDRYPQAPVWLMGLTHVRPPRHGARGTPAPKPFQLHLRPIRRPSTVPAPPPRGGDSGDEAGGAGILQEYATALSLLIREFPGQYLWLHKMWTKGPGALPYASTQHPSIQRNN